KVAGHVVTLILGGLHGALERDLECGPTGVVHDLLEVAGRPELCSVWSSLTDGVERRLPRDSDGVHAATTRRDVSTARRSEPRPSSYSRSPSISTIARCLPSTPTPYSMTVTASSLSSRR